MDDVFTRLVARLDAQGADYRIVEHEPEGRSEIISRIRGHAPGESAKAMVLAVQTPGGVAHALAVVPGDRRVDMAAVSRLVGGRKARFAAPEDATRLTGCAMGAVPPFVLDGGMPLLVDPAVCGDPERYMVFNAGRLDRSMFLKVRDYLAVAQPRIAAVAAPA